MSSSRSYPEESKYHVHCSCGGVTPVGIMLQCVVRTSSRVK